VLKRRIDLHGLALSLPHLSVNRKSRETILETLHYGKNIVSVHPSSVLKARNRFHFVGATDQLQPNVRRIPIYDGQAV